MSEYKLSLVGGGKPQAKGHTFALDNKHFIIPFNNQIKIYSVITRQAVKTIKFKEDVAQYFQDISIIGTFNKSDELLEIFNEAGDYVVLNYKERLVNPVIEHKKLDVGNVTKVLKVENQYYIICCEQNTYSLYSVNEDFTTTLISSVADVLMFANSDKQLLFLTKESKVKYLTIVDISGETNKFPLPITSSNKAAHYVTSMAIDSQYVAIGYATGVINLILLKDFSSRLLKWHIDAVTSLSLTSEYLLSGGHEKVLVYWQLASEKTQFLPRLNGSIKGIYTQNSQYYVVAMELGADLEYLVLSATDLNSRLLVNGPLAVFANDITKKKKKDFTTSFEVMPMNKNLYFVNHSSVQIYDFYKNEQVSMNNLSSVIPMGKVKDEQKLNEPELQIVKFTSNGEFMCSYEIETPSKLDNLLSQNDLSHVLKFWKNVKGQWELLTKIISPHGPQVPIVDIIECPTSTSFLTADNNGGLKLWKFNTKMGQWVLAKSKFKTGLFSNSVSLAWSPDGSLVFHGFGDRVTALEASTFTKFLEFDTLDSTVKQLFIVDDSLIIISNKIQCINLLTMSVVAQFDIYEYASKKHFYKLCALDKKNKRLAIVLNSALDSSKVYVLDSCLKKVGSFNHNKYISAIQWNFDSDFIFIDVDSRLGLVSSTSIDVEEKEIGFSKELKELVQEEQEDEEMEDFINGDKNSTLINMNSFTSLFENIENVQLETLFDRVMKVVN